MTVCFCVCACVSVQGADYLFIKCGATSSRCNHIVLHISLSFIFSFNFLSKNRNKIIFLFHKSDISWSTIFFIKYVLWTINHPSVGFALNLWYLERCYQVDTKRKGNVNGLHWILNLMLSKELIRSKHSSCHIYCEHKYVTTERILCQVLEKILR